MRHTRIIVAAMLLAVGLLGAYWAATAQEGRSPWPPPPVKFEEKGPDLPSAPPKGYSTPNETKAPGNDKDKKGPIRKLIGGMIQGSERSKPAEPTGVAQAGFKDGQEIPPPVPPMPTVMPNPPPAKAGGSPYVVGSPSPPANAGGSQNKMPPAPDLPSIPSPTIPLGSQPVEPKGLTPPAIELPAMPSADPPMKDPSKSLIPSVGEPPASAGGGPPKEKAGGFILFDQKKPAPPLPVITPPNPPSELKTADGALLALQTPAVTVEKRGPATPRPGESLTFQIIVRNQGTISASQVRIDDDWPADAKLVKADPIPHVESGRAVWLLTDVPAGGSRVLNFTLQVGPSGSMTHSTRVAVMASSTGTSSSSPPTITTPPPAAPSPLVVQVAAPSSVAVGKPVTFDVTYANQGTQRLNSLLLRVALTDGLRHPVGQSIEADIGELPAGASKSVKITTNAVAPGRQGIQVRLASPGASEATGQAAVDVVAAGAGLTVHATAARLILGRPNDLRIEVTNHSAKPMRHVSIVSQLPEGVEFVAASDHGLYQPAGRSVSWLLDPFSPGQTQALILRVTPKSSGPLVHQVVARTDGVPEAKSVANLATDGMADLALELVGDNAVEVGRESVYEVRVANPGSGANTNVRVELAFTPGLAPRSAQGPSGHRIDGPKVIFEGVPTLAPQGQLVYRVTVMGQAPGDQRVRAAVISDQIRTPATREKGTKVYRD